MVRILLILEESRIPCIWYIYVRLYNIQSQKEVNIIGISRNPTDEIVLPPQGYRPNQGLYGGNFSFWDAHAGKIHKSL